MQRVEAVGLPIDDLRMLGRAARRARVSEVLRHHPSSDATPQFQTPSELFESRVDFPFSPPVLLGPPSTLQSGASSVSPPQLPGPGILELRIFAE